MKKKRRIKPKAGQHWVEKKTGHLVLIVEGDQNGLVRYHTIESVTDFRPKFAGYWAAELKDWHKSYVRG